MEGAYFGKMPSGITGMDRNMRDYSWSLVRWWRGGFFFRLLALRLLPRFVC